MNIKFTTKIRQNERIFYALTDLCCFENVITVYYSRLKVKINLIIYSVLIYIKIIWVQIENNLFNPMTRTNTQIPLSDRFKKQKHRNRFSFRRQMAPPNEHIQYTSVKSKQILNSELKISNNNQKIFQIIISKLEV